MSREVHVRFCEGLGVQFPRATRLVVLARYQGQRLRSWIETTLEGRFGLTINREKTKVIRLGPIGGEGLDFLGFTLRYERSVLPTTDRYLHVGPSRQAMGRVRQKLRELTSRHMCFKPAPMVVADVNRLLDGWCRYFGYGHPRRAFAAVNFQAYQRLCIHLRRRSQRGCHPPADRSLYEQLYHHLGLKLFGRDRQPRVCRPTKRLRSAGCGKSARPVG
jgi:RNA-directed DNA polymerase